VKGNSGSFFSGSMPCKPSCDAKWSQQAAGHGDPSIRVFRVARQRCPKGLADRSLSPASPAATATARGGDLSPHRGVRGIPPAQPAASAAPLTPAEQPLGLDAARLPPCKEGLRHITHVQGASLPLDQWVRTPKVKASEQSRRTLQADNTFSLADRGRAISSSASSTLV
jgi:hypothetical protein